MTSKIILSVRNLCESSIMKYVAASCNDMIISDYWILILVIL